MRFRQGALATGALSLLLAACGTTSSSGGSSSSSASGGSTSSPAPKQITIGTTYAASGSFSSSSMPEYAGLQFWVRHENAKGGVFVKAYNKRIPLKVISYNDQSSPSAAANYYSQLITQNNVNIFVSDFGSVLSAPAVTIAQEHKMLLFDPTATGASFFHPGDPYIVLTSLRVSTLWPKPLVRFLISKHIKRVAIMYDANEFDATQRATITAGLAKAGIQPVYDQALGVTGTTDYGTLLHSVAATHPDAVLELGYAPNDTAFLQNLQASGEHFKMVFTVFADQLPTLFQSNVGTKGLSYTFTYGEPPTLAYNNVTVGLGTTAFEKAFNPGNPGQTNFLNIAGYNTGLAIQVALANATSFTQLGMRSGLMSQSGKMTTVDGPFSLDSNGAQTGESLPIAQYFPGGAGAVGSYKVIYPSSKATGQAVYPAP